MGSPSMAGLLNTAVTSLTNASVDSLVNGTIDTVLNNTLSSLFNTTYNKNGTTGAVLVGMFLYWKKCGCCSFCCCSCLKPRGTSQCGACNTCPYVIQGPVLRKEKRVCCQACQDPRQMKFISFR